MPRSPLSAASRSSSPVAMSPRSTIRTPRKQRPNACQKRHSVPQNFTESARQVAVYDGKLVGLPYFSTVWVWNYYTDLLEKAKLEPFKTYDELLEQLRKAKKDGVCDYPI